MESFIIAFVSNFLSHKGGFKSANKYSDINPKPAIEPDEMRILAVS